MKTKYLIEEGQESLERTLLMMNYNMKKTLSENVKVISEQENVGGNVEDQQIAIKFRNAVQRLGTDESGIENTLSMIKDKAQFDRVNSLIPKYTTYKNIQDALNGEYETDNLDDVLKVKDILSKKGINLTYKTYVDRQSGDLKYKYKSIILSGLTSDSKTSFSKIDEWKKKFPCVFSNGDNVGEDIKKDSKRVLYIVVKSETNTKYQLLSNGVLRNMSGSNVGKLRCVGNKTIAESKNNLKTIFEFKDPKDKRNLSGGGSYNKDTAEIQQELVSSGYYIGNTGPNKDGIDGIMGPKTREALQKKQEGVIALDYNASKNYPYPKGFDSAKAEAAKKAATVKPSGNKQPEVTAPKEKEVTAQKSTEKTGDKAKADNINKQYFGLDLTDEIGMQEVTDNVVELINKGYQSTIFARYYNLLNELGTEWSSKMANEVKGAKFPIDKLTNSFKKTIGNELNPFKNPTQPQMETGNFRQYKLTVFPKGGTSFRWRDLGSAGSRYQKRDEKTCYDTLKEYTNMIRSRQLDTDMNLRKDKETIFFCFKDGAYNEEGIAKSFGVDAEEQPLGSRRERRNRKKEVDGMLSLIQSENIPSKYRTNLSQLPESKVLDSRIKNVLSEIYESKKRGITENKIVGLRLNSIVEGEEIKTQKSLEKTLNTLVIEVSSLKESGISEEVLNEGLKDWFFGTLGGVLKSPTALLGEYIGKWIVGKLGLDPKSTLGGSIVKLFGNVNITDYPKFFTDCRFTVDKITDSVIEAVADNLIKQKTNVGDGILVDAIRNAIADQILSDKEGLVQKLQDKLYDFICPLLNKAGQKLDDVASQMQDKVVS
jgi:hypothetical protein